MSIRKGNVIIAGTPDLTGYQTVNNMSQTLDDSAVKYPSNAAVKSAIDTKDSLPTQSEDTDMQFLASKYDSTTGTSTTAWSDVPTDPLFAHQWADHYLNDASWLRADTFSWQSGTMYVAAYNHLVADIEGKSLQSETINGITIQFYRADDKHKICLASQEANIVSLYNSTGVSWYYILDTANTRFKLPRTQLGFVGVDGGSNETVGDNVGLYIAGSDLTATQQFLYFYVGNTSRSSKLIDVSVVTEEVNTLKSEMSRTINYNNISNCITYIPQDIKLELNNGILTLKAGSKYTKPEGSSVTLTEDKILTNTWGSAASGMVFIGSNSYSYYPYERIHSGTTNPTNLTGNSHINFNTSDNTIYTTIDKGTNWTSSPYASLPLACVTWDSNNKITSIDQIFNGLGYIGSTLFALPGVKGLIPNGRNADGSLKSTEAVLTKVQVVVISPSNNGRYSIRIGNDVMYHGVFLYDEKTNYNYNESISPSNIRYQFNAGTIEVLSGTIISFTPKTVFHALDYNDTSYISTQAFPSNNYVDLTLNASPYTYIAPANGWFVISKTATVSGQYFVLRNLSNGLETAMYTTGGYISGYIPAKKGDSIYVEYTLAGETRVFRFVYAEGIV